MKIRDSYKLTTIINAAGTFTPLGVSRSSPAVGLAVAEALSEFFVMDELQDTASTVIAEWTGAEAGTVTHCVSAGIVLSIAAAITGNSSAGVAILPDTRGMPNRVVLPAGHAINYGHYNGTGETTGSARGSMFAAHLVATCNRATGRPCPCCCLGSCARTTSNH